MKTMHYLMISLLLIGCKNDTLREYVADEIKGQVFIENNFAESTGATASQAIVYVANTDQTSKFLYSIAADKDGLFTTTYLPSDKATSCLLIRYTAADGLVYEKIYPLNQLPEPNSRGIRDFVVNPVYTKGIIRVDMNEPTTGKPIVDASVLLFTNPSQANSFSDTTPQGVVSQSVTSAKGIVLFTNLDAGSYWVGAKLGDRHSAIESTTVQATTAPPNVKDLKPLSLSFLTVPTPNELIITVLEKKTNIPLAGFQAYLFVNANQAATIGDETVSGSIKNVSTNQSGKVSFKPIDPGTYYVGVVGALPGRKKVPAISGVITIPKGNAVVQSDTIQVE